MRAARRRLVSLAMAVLAVGTLLYLVLVFPDEVRRMLPSAMPYAWVHIGLVAALIVLILSLVRHVRGLGSED